MKDNRTVQDILRDLRNMLLDAPPSEYDPSLRPLAEAWSDPPTPEQVEATYNAAMQPGMASAMVRAGLGIIWSQAAHLSGMSTDDIMAQMDKWSAELGS